MKKKDIRTMDIVLAVIAIFLIIFVGILLLIYYRTGGIPDTLCTCVFTICGGECGIMGWIKTTKERKLERKYQLEDREYEEKMKKNMEE